MICERATFTVTAHMNIKNDLMCAFIFHMEVGQNDADFNATLWIFTFLSTSRRNMFRGLFYYYQSIFDSDLAFVTLSRLPASLPYVIHSGGGRSIMMHVCASKQNRFMDI